MKAITPVVPGFEAEEITIAKDQPPYAPLPALAVDDGQMLITRWKLSWLERLEILISGDLWLWVWTFGKPLQPVALETTMPQLGRKP